jgi:hypothetical protein
MAASKLPGGIAVGSPVAADDPVLDPAGGRGGGVAIALLEVGARLELIPDRHHTSTFGAREPG